MSLDSCNARKQLRHSVSNLSWLRRELGQSVEASKAPKASKAALDRHISAIEQLEDRVLEHFISRRELVAKTFQLTIAVVGDFSSGKSTFINALLGQDLCPTNVSPTTSAITYFSHGPRLCIEMELVGGSRTEIDQAEYKEMARHNGDCQSSPCTFHITTPDPQLSFFRLIDTPGFSSPSNEKYDTAITHGAASKADALIVVLDIHKGNLSRPLLEQLDRLRKASEDKNNRTPSFLLINQADKRTSHARGKVITSNKRKYANLFREIHLISSLRLAKGCDHQVSQDIDQALQRCKQAILERRPFQSSIRGDIVSKTSTTQYEYNIDGNRTSIDLAEEEDLATREDILKLLSSLLPERQRLLELRLEEAEATIKRDQRKVLIQLLRYLHSQRSVETAYGCVATDWSEAFQLLNSGIVEKLLDFCAEAFDAALHHRSEEESFLVIFDTTLCKSSVMPMKGHRRAKKKIQRLIKDIESHASQVFGTPFQTEGIAQEALKIINRNCKFLEKEIYGEVEDYFHDEDDCGDHLHPVVHLQAFARCVGYEIFHEVFAPRLSKLQAEMATSEGGDQRSTALDKARFSDLVKRVEALIKKT